MKLANPTLNISNSTSGISPRLGLTLKSNRPAGGLAARRAKLNLKGVPGLEGNVIDLIHNKADELVAKQADQEKKCFASHYTLDQSKILGQGQHATVYKCYKKADTEKQHPFAVKVAREPDEEKRMAHEKEFKITNGLQHKNVVKSTEYFFNELTEEIHLVMQFVKGQEVLDHLAE